jgi:hypothetical protein
LAEKDFRPIMKLVWRAELKEKKEVVAVLVTAHSWK